MNAKTGAVGSAVKRNSGNSDVHQHGMKAMALGKDKLLLDLNALVDDAQALLKEAADSSAENIADVPAYLEAKLGKIKGNLNRARSAVETKARQATVATDKYVHKNSWKSMGFATVASVLFGFLLFNARPSAPDKSGRNGK